MNAEMAKPRDLETLREARFARRRRINRNAKISAAVGVLLTLAQVAYQAPEWLSEREAEQRFFAARDAVAALREEDRAAFEAMLVPDAPPDVYQASLGAVSIADLSLLQLGFVEDERPSPGEVGGIRRTVSPNPIREIAVGALRAVFSGDRQGLDALLTDDSPPDSWEASVEAISGMTPRDERSASVLRSGMRSKFQGEDLDRCSMSFVDDDAVVQVHMRRVGRTWFVEGPMERTP